MNHRNAKKQPKAPAKRKITGKLSSVTPKQIALQTATGAVWKIDNTPNLRVIKGRVTVEFSNKDGRQIPKLRHIPRKRPIHRDRVTAGKRTETGTVIGLTPQQVTLDNTSPDPGPWLISQTDGGTVIVKGSPLTLGETNVTITFYVPPGQQVNT